MLAAHRGLDNMIWFVDYNKKQLDGYVKEILNPLDFVRKFEAFGFHTQQADGGDVEAIQAAIARCAQVKGKPHCIVLDTVKGAGIPEVEQTRDNHSMNVTKDTCDRWLEALRAQLQGFEGGEEK